MADASTDISLDDVMDELAGLRTPRTDQEMLRLLLLCVVAIRKVPARCLATLPVAQRDIIYSALLTELALLSTPAVELECEPEGHLHTTSLFTAQTQGGLAKAPVWVAPKLTLVSPLPNDRPGSPQ